MKKYFILLFSLSLILFTGIFFPVYSQQNDHIFPPSTSAKKYIDYDRQGFIINGKKTFLVSAGVEYARIPHRLWRDRLLRLKRDGFNCIEMYTFWNFHEPHEGQFDFTGDHDLNAFLKLIKQLGMYAIVRVGPYYCAEWTFGGYPIWLHFKDNMVVREPNAEFEKYADRFFDHLIPIVSNNQINHGGSVILVQLENEHSAGWGTLEPNEYFTHLRKKALSLGLEVPYFFSGLYHGADPAGNGIRAFDNDSRPNPWFTTEFWTVWYNYYGSTQKDADEFGRRTWKIIAHGGGGYNYYMAHGGTNFDYSNNDEDAASYDYGAAVGQTGDLRPIYYQFKANALFARSFENILCNAADVSASYKNMVSDTGINVYARHSENGDIAFIDNYGKKERTIKATIDNRQLPADGGITLIPGEIMPVVKNLKLTPQVTMDYAVTRILGMAKQGNTNTIVAYGPSGSNAQLQFSSTNAIHLVSGKEAFSLSDKAATLKITFNDKEPGVYSFKNGAALIRVIALSTTLANRTWFAEIAGKQDIITGPEYLGDINNKDNHLQLTTEHFWAQDQKYPTWIFSETGVKNIPLKTASAPHKEELVLGKWQTKTAADETLPGFDDSKWLKSATALQMGADNDLSCYAWYRTPLTIKSDGNYILKIRNGGDKATLYLDGKRIISSKIPGDILLPQLTAGKHTLAVFTSHSGRNKLYNYYGSVQYKDAKGLSGDILLQKNKTNLLTDWKMISADSRDAVKNGPPSFDKSTVYNMGDDAFDLKRGFKWFQASLLPEDGSMPKSLYVKNLPETSSIFINGKQFTPPVDGAPGFRIPFNGLLNTQTANTVTIFMENPRDRRAPFNASVEVVYDHNDDIILNDWRMKGGPGNDKAITGWKSLDAAASFDRPEFYKNNFTVQSVNSNVHAMWRVTFDGLGHGSIWVNGHNLGRYPEKVPVKSLYIPECWLVKGNNSLVIYDEDGNRPDKVSIQAEKAASRDVSLVRF